jgi:hypothetical protein
MIVDHPQWLVYSSWSRMLVSAPPQHQRQPGPLPDGTCTERASPTSQRPMLVLPLSRRCCPDTAAPPRLTLQLQPEQRRRHRPPHAQQAARARRHAASARSRPDLPVLLLALHAAVRPQQLVQPSCSGVPTLSLWLCSRRWCRRLLGQCFCCCSCMLPLDHPPLEARLGRPQQRVLNPLVPAHHLRGRGAGRGR